MRLIAHSYYIWQVMYCRFAIRGIAILLLLGAYLCPLLSQELSVKYLGIEKGLSNNTVTAIFQDHNGFMWFGTYDGLNRYDGYEFTVFRNIIGDSSSIPTNNINSIAEDSSHNIWIGGQKELSIYHPVSSRFSTPTYHFSNGTSRQVLLDNVISVQLLKNNTLLAGTQHNGLFYFTNTTDGQQVPLLLNNQQRVDYYVTAIAYDVAGNTAYVMVQNEGLFVYDARRHTLRLLNSRLQQANCLRADGSRTLWLGDNTGLYRVDKQNHTLSGNVMPYKAAVQSVSVDTRGTVWIATDGGGIWLLPAGQDQAMPVAAAAAGKKPLVNSNSIYAIYEDRQQRKWIGTLRGGINIIEPQGSGFRHILYEPSPNSSNVENFILSFCEADTNHIWIGTDGAGLRYWNRAANTFTNYVHDSSNSRSVSSNFITGIVNGQGNALWVSTWFGGINLFNKVSGTFQHYTCWNPLTKRPDNNIWTMMHDSRNRLWACAVRNGGLYLFNPSANRFDMFDSRLTDLQCLAEDSKGNIWSGDYNALYQIDTAHNRHRVYNLGYAVRSIYEDKHQNFWIGTQEGGLLLFDRQYGSYKRYTTADGLPHNTVLRILEGDSGHIWLSTYHGLSRFNPHTGVFRNFSQSDGLQSNQFSFNGALALSNGELLFGGIKGFNIFYPRDIAEKKKNPPLFLTSLRVNNAPVQNQPAYIKEKQLDVIKKIVVPYDEAMLSLDFLGLDYTNAANIHYAYYLQGWDKSWNFVKNVRTANYSRLREGHYVFSVKMSYSNGVWNSPQQLLSITVLPPWYRTWWAYALYVLLGAGAIYLYVMYKSRQAKLQYQVQLAHLETQKEKELNEKKIAFFTNVSHEFRTPLSLIINPIKDLLSKPGARTENAELKVVYRNAQRLLRLVDQLLLFKKADSENDQLHTVKLNFYNLCHDVFSCFLEQARARRIRYTLQADNSSLLLHADREKLEIALFNMLSNAFKYTPDGGEIIFLVQEEATQLLVTISDTGSGISESEGARLFDRFYQVKNTGSKAGFGIGLYLVRHFIEAHGGVVSYKSEPGKGTAFTVVLQKNVAEAGTPAAAAGDGMEQPAVQTPAHNGDPAVVLPPGQAGPALPAEAPQPVVASSIFQEISGEMMDDQEPAGPGLQKELASGQPILLLVDDDKDIRNYLVSIFRTLYKVYEADSAEDGIKLAHKYLPDLIISDIVMKGLNGLDLCRTLKQDSTVSHIPIILLTGTTSDEMQLKGMESGADDYIKKPFDKDILAARVQAQLKRRNVLQSYFYNEITFGSGKFKISDEYKEFLQKCMTVIENHLANDQFSIKVLASEMGMSHSNLYRRIKTVSGQSVNGFIRFIRLRKAAEIFIGTEYNVNETALMVGFNDIKYFRSQFVKLYGLNPSDYIKKYRKPFHNTQHIEDNLRR